MPRARYRSASVCTAARISSSSSRSSAALWNIVFHRLARRAARAWPCHSLRIRHPLMASPHLRVCSWQCHLAFVLCEDLSDRQRDTRPHLPLGGELPLAGRRNPIVLGPSSLGRHAPLSGNEPLLLEPVQQGEERARADLKGAARGLLDAVGDAHAVSWFEGQRLEDEQVQRAFHHFCLTCGHPTSADAC